MNAFITAQAATCRFNFWFYDWWSEHVPQRRPASKEWAVQRAESQPQIADTPAMSMSSVVRDQLFHLSTEGDSEGVWCFSKEPSQERKLIIALLNSGRSQVVTRFVCYLRWCGMLVEVSLHACKPCKLGVRFPRNPSSNHKCSESQSETSQHLVWALPQETRPQPTLIIRKPIRKFRSSQCQAKLPEDHRGWRRTTCQTSRDQL